MAAVATVASAHRRTRPSLLSDALVRDLIATGRVDVVVGLPTLDNAPTVRGVVRAVHGAFAGPFARERTMLLNADGGSGDGTPEIVRGQSTDPSEVVTAEHTLRTIHRITASHHRVPGRGGALHIVFAGADLLRAQVVAVVDAASRSPTTNAISAMIEPVLRRKYDLVKPVVARSPWEAPLVTQLVRPLMRAAYGARLLEPFTPEFACSGALVAEALSADVWDESFAQFGLDAWLVACATGSDRGVVQIWRPVDGAESARDASARPSIAPSGAPTLADVFQDVLGGIASCLASDERWLAVKGSTEVPILGEPPAMPSARPAFDTTRFAASFAQGVRDLEPLLVRILGQGTVDALARASQSSRPHIDDDLWVRAVHASLVAIHRRTLPRAQVIQTMLPVYLGRAASFLAETAAMDVDATEARLEDLAMAFERAKPSFTSSWTAQPTRR